MYPLTLSPRKLLAGFLRYILGWKRASDLLLSAGNKSSQELWQIQRDRADYRRNFLTKWKEEKIDCLLSPAFSTVPAANPILAHTVLGCIS